ncbi:MAG: hypothetical protein K2Q25_11885, partial [Mycobacteriaceae bacterium]|nr:hypothetical protein [Mycobacteriaceae bacterium]
MTLPNGPDGLTPGIQFGVTGNDGSITGLVGRTREAVTEALKQDLVLQNPAWNAAANAVWAGIRRGAPGSPVSLVHGLAEAFVQRLYGVGREFPSLDIALESAARVLTNGMHLGNIPLSAVVAHPTEALHNPGFDHAGAISLSPPWEWDATVGYDSLGSAKVIADGRPKTLISNTVAANPGQQWPMKIHVKYTGLAAAPNSKAIRLSVCLFDANRNWLSTQLVAAIPSPSGNSTGWAELAGTYTVPQGVALIATQLDVTSGATAGTVWFTAGSLKQQGNPSWLQDIVDTAQATRDTIVNRLRGGIAAIGTTVAELDDALAAIPAPNVQGLVALIDDHHALRDGIVNALGISGTGFTPNAVRNNLQEFLQRLPASNIIGELNSALASIAINGVTGLTGFLTNLSAVGLYDASAGFVNQATSILKNLNASGLFDASQLTNIANIPAIAIGSVTNLANTVQRLSSSTGLYDASAGFINQANSLLKKLDSATGLYDASAGFTNQATSILKYLNVSGLFDAAQLTNIANIPAIALSKVTGLTGYLTNLSGTGLYDASAGFVNQATSILKYLNASGLFDASQLTNIANIPAIALSKVTGLTGYLTNLSG